MLLQLNIQNFAIVRSLDIDWQQGMTTITGETGAGKSIAIDALGLCLGDRAITNVVRPNCKKAELAATFDVSKNPQVLHWLNQHDLHSDNECILRRVISAEGRSKAYINGSQVPLAQLKEVGQLLINIHGQHDHQLITKALEQRNILDQYANHDDLLENVKHYYNKYKELTKEYDLLLESKTQREAKQQLLQYQVNELNEFSVQQGEFETLEIEYKKQSNGQHILNESLQALQILSNDENYNIVDQLRKVEDQLTNLSLLDKTLQPLTEQINSSLIQVEDAASELTHYYERLELDPQNYQVIEERYSQIIQLAKKHQISPDKLYELHQQLNTELQQMTMDESRLTSVADEIEQTKITYQQAAEQLSTSRKSSANKLSQLISASMNELNMPHGKFAINVNYSSTEKISSSGTDNVEFLVSLNPGQALEAMNKVASGGELSRISLAMQVILSAKVITPTLIFDEVDVGISGPTASMVGKKLQQLSQSTQVICVTHLPQVASKGRQQLFVAKLTDGEHTETTVTELTENGRVQEIARLLAGDKITDNSLANAQELLAG
ncbi:DNA repair protein RecN [Thalassotalea profundi]|uniref:DNA repair protein RecN n=1 Tax=Thalassotalea profundi TaxID=2036687 RepID=A0ABQ3IMA6_9GAMM|nr:DNA repair protein RecN [Thalassotalea profundi]GHE85707.1 DNA repair protein RecN [Thalassotalea profundi]